MAGIALGQLVGNKLGILAFHRLALEKGHHFVGQCLVPADEAGVQHAGLDRHVILGQLDAFHRCTECIADFQPHVPEGIKHVFDHTLRMRTGFVSAQEEKVGIRGRRHDSPAIAADSDDRQTLGFGRVGGSVDVGDSKIIERVNYLVLHRGKKAGRVEPVCPLLQALLRDQAAAEHGAVQEVQGLFAGGLRAVHVVQCGGGELHAQRAGINDVGNAPFARPAGNRGAGRPVGQGRRGNGRRGHRSSG